MLAKEFTFTDFKEASNFVKRYTDFCQKTGAHPHWSNVYNTVSVQIKNHEFGSISSKDVEVAQYLDMLEKVKVTNYININDNYSFEHIVNAG